MPAPSVLPPVLLMTRPRAASERFLGAVAQDLLAQVEVVISPVIEIAPCAVEDVPSHAGLVLTSQAAVPFAADLLPDRQTPAYCVGPATTAAARHAGWPAQEAGSDADGLIRHLIAERPEGPLLHLRGAHGRGAVAERLSRAGLPCAERVVYDQPAMALTDQAHRALRARCCVLPVFSPRSASLLADQIGAGGALHLIALSPAVAAPLAEIGGAVVHVCAAPNAAEMQKLLSETLSTLLHRSMVL